MRIPIAVLPRLARAHRGTGARLDLRAPRPLSFEEPDLARFPALGLGRRAARGGRVGADRAQRRQRGAVRSFWPAGFNLAGISALVEAALEGACPEIGQGTRKRRRRHFPLTIIRDCWRRSLLPEIAAKAS